MDYCELRSNPIIQKSLAYELIGVSKEDFYTESYKVIDKDKAKAIFS